MVDAQLVHPKDRGRAMSYPATYGTNNSEVLDSKEDSIELEKQSTLHQKVETHYSKMLGYKTGAKE